MVGGIDGELSTLSPWRQAVFPPLSPILTVRVSGPLLSWCPQIECALLLFCQCVALASFPPQPMAAPPPALQLSPSRESGSEPHPA